MNNSLSPHDMATNMATYTPTPHAAHRLSRSSNSQSGHSFRVEKPRSIHNSPRPVERRRTTTGAKLYATLDDHYNMMLGISPDEEAADPVPEPVSSRPMSWHPSSTQFNAGYQPNANNQSQNWNASSRMSGQGSDFYSLSTRNSMSAEPSHYFPTYATGYDAHRGSQDSDSSWQTQQSYATSAYSTPAIEPMPWYLQEWARRNHDQVPASHGASADFLPIQHPAEPEEEQQDESMEESGKELIGMGLYDTTDASLEWTSPVGEATGKGLKLEETWQPPEEEDDGEDDAEEEQDEEQDDDTSSDDGEEELPPPPAPMAPVNHAKSTPSSNLEGQSFFFDEDDSVTKEWWYQHLKQPSIPVRDTGYGYGWL